MIRGVGKDVVDSKTEYVGLDFYRPRNQLGSSLECSNLRIVQRNGYGPDSDPDTRMSWDFPKIRLILNGKVPKDIDTLSINLHWRDTDIFKAAYHLNKNDELIVEIYFGNMSENDRKNRMVRSTVTFSPRISLPKAKTAKYLHLSTDETLPFDATSSSLLSINKQWMAHFWDESWLESSY